MDISLYKASVENITIMLTGFPTREATFKEYFQEQTQGERLIWIAECNSDFAGYITLKINSEYKPFRIKGIPEIKDLNVLPQYRKLGIATMLLAEAEKATRAISEVVGIGVGLFEDYGPAQRLYIKQGYMPDGLGVCYNDKHVSYGEKVLIDDDFCLFLIKSLV